MKVCVNKCVSEFMHVCVCVCMRERECVSKCMRVSE